RASGRQWRAVARGFLPRLFVSARNVLRAWEQVSRSVGIGFNSGTDKLGLLWVMSMTPERVLVESAYALACSLPNSTIEAVAAAILACSEGSLRAEISKRVAHHQHRDLALAFVDRWKQEARDLDARTVAVALQTA